MYKRQPLEEREDIPWLTVAGVVGDVRQTSLAEAPGQEFYVPYAQDTNNRAKALAVVMRTQGSPMALAGLARDAVRTQDPSLPFVKMATMEDVLWRSLAERAVVLRLVGLFSLLALILTGVGVYGLLSYNVAQRGRELGIRAALGALKGDLLKLVLAQALRLALSGLVLGFLLSLASGSLLQGLLVQTSASEIPTLLGVALILLALALLAALVPAWRASRVQPAEALRSE